MSDSKDTTSKKILIITGPQGSGNHLFSRLFSLHDDVGGWEELNEKYWVPSDEETFAEYWVYPERLKDFDFSKHDYWVANVSCPFMYDGTRYTPKIKEFADECIKLGIDVTIGIIVRDKNINAEQQKRVRKEVTLPIALNYYYTNLLDYNVHFLDHEAFFLHKAYYLRYVSKILDFPVAYDNPDIMKFIWEDANHKYVKYVDEHWLDKEVWDGIRTKEERNV